MRRTQEWYEQVRYTRPEKLDRIKAPYALGAMKLSASAKAVGAQLVMHTNNTTGKCNPSIDRLCYGTQLAESTVKKAIRQLEKKGILKRQRVPCATNGYHLQWSKLRKIYEDFYERAMGGADVAKGGYQRNLKGGTNVTPNIRREHKKGTYELFEKSDSLATNRLSLGV